MNEPTQIAALCLLHGQLPKLAHVPGDPGESAETLLGRSLMLAREQFPGCAVVDFSVLGVESQPRAEDWLLAEQQGEEEQSDG